MRGVVGSVNLSKS